MRPIPGRIPVFFIRKGVGGRLFSPQWLLLLLPLRCGEPPSRAPFLSIITSFADFGSKPMLFYRKKETRRLSAHTLSPREGVGHTVHISR